MSREVCLLAGEPELAVATHCLQRPIVAYKQARIPALSLSSSVIIMSQSMQCLYHKTMTAVLARRQVALDDHTACCLQVRTSLLGERTLQRVSVYGAEDYPENSPVCVLFSGAHYDTLLQVPVAK